MPDRNTPMKGGELVAVPVAAGAVIDGGTLVAVNATGFAVPAAGTSGLTVVGVAGERVDNTGGADGAAMCRVPVGACVYHFKSRFKVAYAARSFDFHGIAHGLFHVFKIQRFY